MYGMVNQAIEDLVVSNHGLETWDRIKARAGVTEVAFIRNEGYPDKITYDLVSAASEVLARPAHEVLHAFGVHWVLNTAVKGYPILMSTAGMTFGKFLQNLPRFHDRVAIIYPNLAPPRFEVSEVTDNSLRLHYISHRPGLTPFVEGLLSGLAQHFAVTIRVQLERSRTDGGNADVFQITW